MPPLREARYYEPLADGRVRCVLCPHDCRIADGSRGACAVRYNADGALYTLAYDTIVGLAVEPIEKKPLFHFMPGTRALSFATVGCPLQCAFCQNAGISQWPRQHLPRRLRQPGTDAAVQELEALARSMPGTRATPADIVDKALSAGAASIAYTFTDPVVFYELTFDTARLARRAGLKNILVTSGFVNERPLRDLAHLVDAVNVDLKFIHDDPYRRICRAHLTPVLDAIRLFRALGVWVELTTLVIPGRNDSPGDLREMAHFVRSVGRDVPWHVSRFHPAFRMQEVPPTPIETLRRARQIGFEAGLQYVYVGNVPGEPGEDTVCPECHTVVIERRGTVMQMNRLHDGRCPACDTSIEGVGMASTAAAA